MISTATTFLVVGGALLAPSLLFAPGSMASEAGGAGVDDTYETKFPVSDAHRAAMEIMRKPICGVADNAPKNLEIANRFIRVMTQLIPLCGAIPTSKGLANVSSEQAAEIHSALNTALLAGVNKGGYWLGETTLKYPTQGALAVGILASEEDVTDLNPLGAAYKASVWARNLANLGGEVYFAEDSMRAAAHLAVALDTAGVDYGNLGALIDDLLETLDPSKFGVDVVAAAPGKIADAAGAVIGKLGGVAADAVSALLTSTPMLAIVAGLIVWKAAGK